MCKIINGNFRRNVDVNEIINKYNTKKITVYFHFDHAHIELSLEKSRLYIRNEKLIITEKKHEMTLDGCRFAIDLDKLQDYKVYLSEVDRDLIISKEWGLIHINTF